MERWCETNAIGSLHGRCRVHRAEILRLRGSCNEAETQALARLRGTAPVLAARAGVAAERARTDPTSQARHRGRRGSPAGRASRRVGSSTRSRARASGPGRRRHRGRLHTRRTRAPPAGAVEGATTEHRPAARAAARGAGRDRDRGRRHRPGPIGRRRAGAHRGRDSRAKRWSPAPPSRAEECGSPTATRRARSSPFPRRCDSGTKSAPRTRRRSHASASPRPTAPAAASSAPSWSSTRPARSSTASKPRRPQPHKHRSRHHDALDERADRELQRLSSRG